MEWLELRTLVDREAVEAVSELFARHAYGGGIVVEEPIIPERGGDGYSIDFQRPVVVKAYLPRDEHAAAKQELIAEGLWHLGRLRDVEALTVTAIAEEDWANAWRVHYQVHRVGKRLVIKPSWQEYQPRPGDVVVDLDPGMAFGTGLHPTTQLCLRALERYVQSGMRVLDVGTGSGILAIAAVKLGAAQALGLDLDAIAVSAARENVARNALSGAITVRLGTLDQDGETGGGYDLVVANITARVIAGLAQALAGALAAHGRLVLSGIIADQESLVRGALRGAGLKLVARHVAGDWLALIAALTVRRPGGRRDDNHRDTENTESCY